MKVKELVESLQKCNQDFDVYCGWESDGQNEFGSAVNVSEVNNVLSYGSECTQNGIYIGVE
jgi:hypothetical protein